MIKHVKTAISVPAEDFKRVELLRRRIRKTRSEVFMQALHLLFKMAETQELEDRYERGYRLFPEKEEETSLLPASLSILKKERW